MPPTAEAKGPGRAVPRIVVIGAGFGGLAVVRGLRLAPADVTVIDRTNHNLFQPPLYQVATAALAPPTSPCRSAGRSPTGRGSELSWAR